MEIMWRARLEEFHHLDIWVFKLQRSLCALLKFVGFVSLEQAQHAWYGRLETVLERYQQWQKLVLYELALLSSKNVTHLLQVSAMVHTLRTWNINTLMSF